MARRALTQREGVESLGYLSRRRLASIADLHDAENPIGGFVWDF